MYGEKLLIVGAVLCTAALVCMIAELIIYRMRKKKLMKKLLEEYGDAGS